MAINDNGIVVGFTQIPYHAFVYEKGRWTNIEFPGASATWAVGISNTGGIVGNVTFSDRRNPSGFLYHNGIFQVIWPPNTGASSVSAISLKSGLILGTAYLNSGGPQLGFIAQCIAP